jgi:hypothetical protein
MMNHDNQLLWPNVDRRDYPGSRLEKMGTKTQ